MGNLAKRIKYYRTRKGVTQEYIALKLGIKASNYAKYESGDRTPREDTLLKIAQILSVSCDALENGVERSFVELLNRYIRISVLGDLDCFDAYYSDVIEDVDVYEIISDCFNGWHKKIKSDLPNLSERFLDEPDLLSMMELRTLYKKHFCDDHEMPSYDGSTATLDNGTFLKLMFCIAMSNYMTMTDSSNILSDVQEITDTELPDVEALQFFAVQWFVPYLAFVADAVELTQNTNIIDFEIAFLYNALTPPDDIDKPYDILEELEGMFDV